MNRLAALVLALAWSPVAVSDIQVERINKDQIRLISVSGIPSGEPCRGSSGSGGTSSLWMWVRIDDQWYRHYESIGPSERPTTHDLCGIFAGDIGYLESRLNRSQPVLTNYHWSMPPDQRCTAYGGAVGCNAVFERHVGLGATVHPVTMAVNAGPPMPAVCSAQKYRDLDFGTIDAKDINGKRATGTVIVTCDKSASVIVRFMTREGSGKYLMDNGLIANLEIDGNSGELGSFQIVGEGVQDRAFILAAELVSTTGAVQPGKFAYTAVVRVDIL